MINGVTVRPLKRFPDERGAVMHMMRANDPHFERFGEIYFSTVNPGQVKAWHRHRRKTVNLAVPIGRIRLVVFDPEASTEPEVIELSPENYQQVTIHPGIWYGFQCLGAEEALLANCATEPFDPDEGESLPTDSSEIPYTWEPVHG